jgi:hypothetical protein
LSLGETQRARNRICPMCKRKCLAPERGNGNWTFAKLKVCFNCRSFKYGSYDRIHANKRLKIKTVRQANNSLRLYLIDMTRNELLGTFEDFWSPWGKILV